MRALLVLACIASVPTATFAQTVITGVVTDPSGALVADVLVEATSPALIEKTRTAITDSAGRYRIEVLPPGTYQVTFTGHGWTPYRQEGIELGGSFTATVNAAFTVGAFTEAVQVVREVPAVDVHSATREVTLTGETVKSIPTVRSYNALLVLVPGVVTTTNDTVTGTATTNFPIHGGRITEGRLLLDGLNIGSPPTGNSATSYVVDLGNAQEVTLRTSNAAGELETSGLVMNIVPKSGGNTVNGSVFASGTGRKLQSDNLHKPCGTRASGRPLRSPGSTTSRARSAARSGGTARGSL